ncbi:MAG: enoyl-CoA hydratase-related protein [Pseudomonadales bacterium]
MKTIDTGTEELLCHIEKRVCVITLNKPRKKNALGDLLTPALRTTLAAVEDDERVGCVMLTGAGDAFCSGGDVTGMGGGSARGGGDNGSDSARGGNGSARGGNGNNKKPRQDRIAELTHKQMTLTHRLHEHKKVTLAALPGAAAGAGLSIALACDLRVAADTAFVTTAFRNIGLSGDYGASWFLPRLIGLARAKEMFYTGRRVHAEEAARLGIFNEVFPADTFREDALAYAEKIAMGPTATLGRMKINLNRGMDQSLRESLALEAQHLIDSGGSEAREAISAFMEKRSPVFHKD